MICAFVCHPFKSSLSIDHSTGDNADGKRDDKKDDLDKGLDDEHDNYGDDDDDDDDDNYEVKELPTTTTTREG